MQKIMLTLLFCSAVGMANNDQNNDNEMNGILKKTLKEVKSFKKEKNQEIKALRVEISLLKRNFNSSKSKQKKEIRAVKAKLKVSEKKVLIYKKAQIKANKQLKVDKKIIKDLHFMIKHKNEVLMDEYALGGYYFNL
jgi:hypothetical protein